MWQLRARAAQRAAHAAWRTARALTQTRMRPGVRAAAARQLDGVLAE
jgi:hypothetical protein